MAKKRFSNLGGSDRSIGDLLRWLSTRKPIPWPKSVPIGPTAQPPTSVSQGKVLVTFVNHSTVLLQTDEVNILFDPIWSKRAGPFSRSGPRRVHPPGILFKDLPPIHIVLISHNHYDHLDLPTLRRLKQKHHPRFISGLGNKPYLEKHRISPTFELDWWKTIKDPSGLKFTFVPARHFSARWLWDRNKTLWGGFVVHTSKGLIFFAGDTGYGDHFKMIKERLGAPILAFLPIGAFEPRWFMAPAHMSPSDAVQAHMDLGAKQSMGIHFGTFHMADEGIDEPTKKLKHALSEAHLSSKQFWTLKPGESKAI